MGNEDSRTGQQAHEFQTTITKTVGCKYLLFLPKQYGSRGNRWPLILFLHGAGERGDDLELVKTLGLPAVLDGQEEFPFIVVAPQCPEGGWWSTDVLNALLEEIIDNYSVGEDRVYATGLSMGGYGTWNLAVEYPRRFAAIAPICGGGISLLAYRLKDVPVWAFHGAKDDAVALSESEKMVDSLRESGGNVRFTVYPEAGHDSWTQTYDNPELYEWFLQHRRRTN